MRACARTPPPAADVRRRKRLSTRAPQFCRGPALHDGYNLLFSCARLSWECRWQRVMHAWLWALTIVCKRAHTSTSIMHQFKHSRGWCRATLAHTARAQHTHVHIFANMKNTPGHEAPLIYLACMCVGRTVRACAQSKTRTVTAPAKPAAASENHRKEAGRAGGRRRIAPPRALLHVRARPR